MVVGILLVAAMVVGVRAAGSMWSSPRPSGAVAASFVGSVGDGGNTEKGLVLIKSFKTGSTTLSTYLAQVGNQRGSYFLHPRKTGWFAEGELLERYNEGQRFDMSVRHITPYTPYRLMELLVPHGVFVTIMRRPLDRFISLFNFRRDMKRRFKTPQALVDSIQAGNVDMDDSRPFCNQLAWLLSGENIDYTTVVDPDEAKRVADGILLEAEHRKVTVLLTERMSESVVLLAHLMGWDIEELELRRGSQRVQARAGAISNKHGQTRRATAANTTFTGGNPHARQATGRGNNRVTRDDEGVGKGNQGVGVGNDVDEIIQQAGVPDAVKYHQRRRMGSSVRRDYSTCETLGGEACEKAIRDCNMVDELLYAHYEQQFDVLLTQLADVRRAVTALEAKPQVKSEMSKLESGTFPPNCIEAAEQGKFARQPGGDETEDQRYRRLHSCTGRPP